jgi:hypothetical protein
MALALACWSSSGCLAADQPTFEEPGKTPPFLLAQRASPVVTKPVPDFLDDNVKKVDLSVEVRSEDAGDPLVAKLVFNYATEQPLDLGPSGTFLPGTLADTKRKLELVLNRSSLPVGWTGCQQVSMVVTHESKVTIKDGIQFPTDVEEIGVITWWFNIPDPSPLQSTLDRCSQRSGTVQ